jgi:hypothetical protein
LAAVVSSVVKLLEDRIITATTNRVRWGTWSTLAVTLSHFLELWTELELLGSGRNVDLMNDPMDAL